jgi:hypothetical protein
VEKGFFFRSVVVVVVVSLVTFSYPSSILARLQVSFSFFELNKGRPYKAGLPTFRSPSECITRGQFENVCFENENTSVSCLTTFRRVIQWRSNFLPNFFEIFPGAYYSSEWRLTIDSQNNCEINFRLDFCLVEKIHKRWEIYSFILWSVCIFVPFEI